MTNPPGEVRVRVAAHSFNLVLLLLGLGCLVGCATRPEPPMGVRVAVLDGRVDPMHAETRRTQSGFLLADRNRFDDGNAGRHMADALSLEVDKIWGVQTHPRPDVGAMMAQKERLLALIEPGMTSGERYDFLLGIDPVDYGKELNADYVLVPFVREARMIQNRTVFWWYSKVAVNLQLWDVDKGEVVWEWKGSHTGYFRSQRWVMEDLAERARRSLARKQVIVVQ